MEKDYEYRFGNITDTVKDLIDIVKSEKAKEYDNINTQTYIYLNSDLHIDHFKKVISETNNQINTIARSNGFGRVLVQGRNGEDLFKFGLTQSEHEEYTSFKFSEVDLWVFREKYLSGEDVHLQIDLPKFQLITDYLALLEYYDTLNGKLTELEKGGDVVELKDNDAPKQKGENMQLELFDNMFAHSMTAGAKPSKLDMLKEDLRANVCIYNRREITALADIIYKSGYIHKNCKPKSFSAWLIQFCKIIDCPIPKNKQNQVTNEFDRLKSTYYYLFPL